MNRRDSTQKLNCKRLTVRQQDLFLSKGFENFLNLSLDLYVPRAFYLETSESFFFLLYLGMMTPHISIAKKALGVSGLKKAGFSSVPKKI